MVGCTIHVFELISRHNSMTSAAPFPRNIMSEKLVFSYHDRAPAPMSATHEHLRNPPGSRSSRAYRLLQPAQGELLISMDASTTHRCLLRPSLGQSEYRWMIGFLPVDPNLTQGPQE